MVTVVKPPPPPSPPQSTIADRARTGAAPHCHPWLSPALISLSPSTSRPLPSASRQVKRVMLHANMVLEEQLSLEQAAMEAQAGLRAGAGAVELIQSSLAQEGAKGRGFSLTHPPSSIELVRARKFPPS